MVSEASPFDDHSDIFADLTHKPKEKKSKKKVEATSIFDDDMGMYSFGCKHKVGLRMHEWSKAG